MIKPRYIYLLSDCGHYEIIARLVSEQNCFSHDNWTGKKSYAGSHWDVTMKEDGKEVKWIVSLDRTQYVNYGRYGTGLCPHGMKLNKNTILYGAFLTERFGRALAEIDRAKVTSQWHHEYVKARKNEKQV